MTVKVVSFVDNPRITGKFNNVISSALRRT